MTLRCYSWLIALSVVAYAHALAREQFQVSKDVAPDCSNSPSTLHLSEPPYENYLVSDCHSAAHVVVTSPLPDSDLSLIAPRLLVSDSPAGISYL